MGKIGVNITVEHLDEIKNAFARFPEIVAPYLRDASMKSALLLEGESKKRTPVSSGRLRASISTSLGVGIQGIGSIVATGVNYALAVHEGSKAHWTSVGNLKDWAKAHNISPYAVQWSIAHKRRKGRPFMKDAARENEGEVSRIYQTQINKGLEAIKNMAQ